MVLGNSIGCTSTTNYTLTMSSTAGGSVTPAVGAHTYSAGAGVNLIATPDGGYRFVNWTAPAGNFTDATAAHTTFTMPAQDVTVTAHFALGVFIDNVPDTNQPPTATLITTLLITNFCAPIAMANVLEYWDDVANHANAQNVTAGLIPETVAEYLGWFMDTNNNGSPDRGNGPHLGTKDKDIAPGTLEFVRWDAAHNPPGITAPPFPLPAGKLGYNWSVLMSCLIDPVLSLNLYKNEINAGRPLVVSFDYWNPVDKHIAVTDPESGETIDVFAWNITNPGGSHYPDPEEYWVTNDIGHAVTGVGYILNWDPDGAGSLLPQDYVIVHDNWPTTPKNVAIPWANWMCLFPVSP